MRYRQIRYSAELNHCTSHSADGILLRAAAHRAVTISFPLHPIRLLVAAVASLALSGCASIVAGTNQNLSVDTTSNGTEVAGAQCALTNDKGTWFVRTPGTVAVHRSYDALNVKCTDVGYQPAVATSASSTKGMAFGNLLFGGLIGAGVDMSTGAAYDYPNLITVPMVAAPAAAQAPIS